MSLDHLKGGCESILISLPRPGTACSCCFTNLKAESLWFFLLITRTINNVSDYQAYGILCLPQKPNLAWPHIEWIFFSFLCSSLQSSCKGGAWWQRKSERDLEEIPCRVIPGSGMSSKSHVIWQVLMWRWGRLSKMADLIGLTHKGNL